VFLITAILVLVVLPDTQKSYPVVVWIRFSSKISDLSIFSYTCCSFVYFLLRNVYSDNLPIYNHYLSSLYTLDINLFSDEPCAGCLFTANCCLCCAEAS
jgi:hypothetical protein